MCFLQRQSNNRISIVCDHVTINLINDKECELPETIDKSEPVYAAQGL